MGRAARRGHRGHAARRAARQPAEKVTAAPD
jgi:hypothetical protein